MKNLDTKSPPSGGSPQTQIAAEAPAADLPPPPALAQGGAQASADPLSSAFAAQRFFFDFANRQWRRHFERTASAQVFGPLAQGEQIAASDMPARWKYFLLCQSRAMADPESAQSRPAYREGYAALARLNARRLAEDSGGEAAPERFMRQAQWLGRLCRERPELSPKAAVLWARKLAAGEDAAPFSPAPADGESA